MTILAIDPGCRTGIALSDFTSETLDFKKHDDIAKASCEFRRILLSYFKSDPICRIIIERPFFNMHSKHTYLTISLINVAHMVAFENNIPRNELSAAQVRKTLLGRARRMKEESVSTFDRCIFEAVEKKGFHPRTEHEADAAALLIVYEKFKQIDLHVKNILKKEQVVLV